MPENLDLLYAIMQQIYANAMHLIAGICLGLFCKGYSKKKIAGWCVGAVYFAVLTITYYIPLVMSGFLAYSIAAFAGLLVFCLIDRANYRTKLFLTTMFLTLNWTINYLTILIGGIISFFLLKMIAPLTSGYTESYTWLLFYSEFVAECLLEILLFGIVLTVLLRKLQARLLYHPEDMELRELFFLLIPAVNGIVIRMIISVYVPFYNDRNQISAYNINISHELLQLFCCLVILASIISTVILYQSIRKKRDEEEARVMLENQVRDIRAHITEVEKLYSNIRGVKHDLKNHIEIINGLLAQGKTEEARGYTRTLSETAEAFDFTVRTGNPVTDVILQEKKSMADEKNIEFLSNFHYPADTDINAFDVSVILSNALSNAIEAAGAGGMVKVSSFRNKNAYLITIENSFEGTLEIDSESGFPKTGKADKTEHGFGLQNMKSVAAKYYGDVQIRQEEDRVILTVMMIADRGIFVDKRR